MAQLKWKRVVNTDAEVIWESGPYRVIGVGRIYGGGIRRDWTLRRDDKKLSEPSRLAEAKREAQLDADEREKHVLILLVSDMLGWDGTKEQWEQVGYARRIEVVDFGVEHGYLERFREDLHFPVELRVTKSGELWAERWTGRRSVDGGVR